MAPKGAVKRVICIAHLHDTLARLEMCQLFVIRIAKGFDKPVTRQNHPLTLWLFPKVIYLVALIHMHKDTSSTSKQTLQLYT